MNKQQALRYINTAMQLRTPQYESLEIFAEYLESTAWGVFLNKMKKADRNPIRNIEDSAREHFSSVPLASGFHSFDGRAFPAFTFALATGVGKTRLMGAFVAYLFLVYGVQNFLLVAPGNTIYRKLVDDFSKMNNPKYVFRGIEEVNSFTANIITKDNYDSNPGNTNMSLFGNKLQINIFNIQQFAEKKSKDADLEWKGINAFSENHWKTYFEYLSELDDLVVLLDESHHYHAEAAFDSLDRMWPLVGLEFTATPYTGKIIGRGKEKIPETKSNIVFNYNLGNAIRDKYVKDPWIGTEADFDSKQFDTETLDFDRRKLQLGAYFHERTRAAIAEYASENNVKAVKPVMLVVAKDTEHASELKHLIDSDDFRGGIYKWKVIEVHTKTKWDEADEAVDKLISLESEDNYVEVVIHVNMLKEWWDVANIYTIVPLRQAASSILTEQTIGRGLRLPYGSRVSYYDESIGKKKYELVDRVMIVAHDKFAQVVELARESNLIQPTNIEQISYDDAGKTKILVETKSIVVEKIEEQIKQNTHLMSEIRALAEKELEKKFDDTTPSDVRTYAIEKKTDEMVGAVATEQIRNISFEAYHAQKSELESREVVYEEWSIFAQLSPEAKTEVKVSTDGMRGQIELRNIPIPRLILTPHYSNIRVVSFTLDTSKLSRLQTNTTILEQALQWDSQMTIWGWVVGVEWRRVTTRLEMIGSWTSQSPESTIISWLLDFPLIDYEEQKMILVSLAQTAVEHYRTFAKNEDHLKEIVENNFHQIATEIYQQVNENKVIEWDGFLDSWIRSPYPALLPYNVSMEYGEQEFSLVSQLDTFPRSKVYSWFTKACHKRYKFDSSDEARLAYLLDREPAVEDWLRPAPNQFEWLYWRDSIWNDSRRYEPDFVVEFDEEIVMIEVKPDMEIMNDDVLAKKKSAETYCNIINANIWKFGIVKPWRYIIIPTSRITITSTITWLIS